ncbi:hypothetical protein H5395_17360 [Paracoccus sp. MC1854]|uniref:hypothetical protein n=1 Tax=Paracoccus sp. MC1854 TaxID=2760306 RepID=UPI001601BA12|nr:hypothetical protein [Paracoccus sp. MC1854]MBB1493227.1 hypothetical protein [Paracoccus sp. MC1854]
MTEQEIELWKQLRKVADDKHDGHLTIMKFTTNWRIAFFTPVEREQVGEMAVGSSFAEAARKALIE